VNVGVYVLVYLSERDRESQKEREIYTEIRREREAWKVRDGKREKERTCACVRVNMLIQGILTEGICCKNEKQN